MIINRKNRDRDGGHESNPLYRGGETFNTPNQRKVLKSYSVKKNRFQNKNNIRDQLCDYLVESREDALEREREDAEYLEMMAEIEDQFTDQFFEDYLDDWHVEDIEDFDPWYDCPGDLW